MKCLIFISAIYSIFIKETHSNNLWNLLYQVKGAHTTQATVPLRTSWDVEPLYNGVEQGETRTHNLNKIIQHRRKQQARRGDIRDIIIQSFLYRVRGLLTESALYTEDNYTTEAIGQSDEIFVNHTDNATEQYIIKPTCHTPDSKKNVLIFDLNDLQYENVTEIKYAALTVRFQGISAERFTPDQFILLIGEASVTQDNNETLRWFEYIYFSSDVDYLFHINVTEQIHTCIRNTTEECGLLLSVQTSFGQTLPTELVFGDNLSELCSLENSWSITEEPELDISPLAYLNVTIS